MRQKHDIKISTPKINNNQSYLFIFLEKIRIVTVSQKATEFLKCMACLSLLSTERIVALQLLDELVVEKHGQLNVMVKGK